MHKKHQCDFYMYANVKDRDYHCVYRVRHILLRYISYVFVISTYSWLGQQIIHMAECKALVDYLTSPTPCFRLYRIRVLRWFETLLLLFYNSAEFVATRCSHNFQTSFMHILPVQSVMSLDNLFSFCLWHYCHTDHQVIMASYSDVMQHMKNCNIYFTGSTMNPQMLPSQLTQNFLLPCIPGSEIILTRVK